MTLKAKQQVTIPLTHEQRQRLWWKAQRCSFAYMRYAKNPRFTRKEWAQMVYRIFIRHPDTAQD